MGIPTDNNNARRGYTRPPAIYDYQDGKEPQFVNFRVLGNAVEPKQPFVRPPAIYDYQDGTEPRFVNFRVLGNADVNPTFFQKITGLFNRIFTALFGSKHS